LGIPAARALPGEEFCDDRLTWIVSPEALAPFRSAQAARAEGEPEPLPYLLDPADQEGGALDLELEVLLLTPGMKAKGLPPHRLALSDARHMYWTVAQLVAHHASGGCNLRPGDLLGTGTISAPDESGLGSLLETTNGGRKPLELASGETRRFLEDGDTVILKARGVLQACPRSASGSAGRQSFQLCRPAELAPYNEEQMGVADLTLADMVRGGARSFGKRTWLVTETGRLTHQDCLDRMEATARRLAGAGVGRGDRVALLAQNRPEHLDFLFAAARLGAILVEVNWRLSADEIAHVLRDTTPKVVVSEPAYAETLAGLRPSLAIERWWSLDEAGAGLESWASSAGSPLPRDGGVGR
jgi:hypothetical protein